MLHLLAMIAAIRPADAAPTEWRSALGGHVDPRGEGIFELGVRKGDLSAEFLTSGLSARWEPDAGPGGAWLDLHTEHGTVGRMHDPWSSGTPAPERAVRASRVGLDGGWSARTRHGLTARVDAFASRFWFAQTTPGGGAAPPARTLLGGDLTLGWQSNTAAVLLSGGADWSPEDEAASPHVRGRAWSRPDQEFAPTADLRVGWAEGQDRLTRTRVGGLDPSMVPIAGAALGEFWVEDYVALRLGPTWRTATRTLGFFADAASIAGLQRGTAEHIVPWQVVWGVGASASWRPADGPWIFDLDAGLAPGAPRADDSLPWAVRLVVGSDWRSW